MNRSKPLTREQYLKKFSRSVRWRLPPQDAEEAIADYRELIFQEGRDETKLAEELGDPVQAARLLTDTKTYHQWQKVFAVLAFGLLVLAKWDFTGFMNLRLSFPEEWWPSVWVMAVGLPLALYWFRRHGQKNGALSGRLVLALITELIAGTGVIYWIWDISGRMHFYNQTASGTMGVTNQEVNQLFAAMMYVGTLSALAALVGLVLARCRDRRWLALYTLGLTVAVMIAFSTFVIRWVDLSMSSSYELRPYLFAHIFPIGAVGLIGTGVALC